MYKITFALLITFTLGACSKKDITSFSAAAGINFMAASVEYSFITNPKDEYVQEIAVKVIGDTTSYDRTFNVAVVRDTSTTAPDNQYEVLEGVVKKGQFTGLLKVRLLNSPALATSKISVKLKFVESKDFKPGNIETSTFLISWTDKVLVPSWQWYRFFFTSVASTAAYRIIVETTGLTTLTTSQYLALGQTAVTVLGTQFGDYVKQWNKDHPNDRLKHDDGTQAGREIVPLYYTRSKYD